MGRKIAYVAALMAGFMAVHMAAAILYPLLEKYSISIHLNQFQTDISVSAMIPNRYICLQKGITGIFDKTDISISSRVSAGSNRYQIYLYLIQTGIRHGKLW